MASFLNTPHTIILLYQPVANLDKTDFGMVWFQFDERQVIYTLDNTFYAGEVEHIIEVLPRKMNFLSHTH